MAKRKFFGFSLAPVILGAFVLAGCAATAKIMVTNPPMWDMTGVKRIGVVAFDRGQYNPQVAKILTTKALGIITQLQGSDGKSLYTIITPEETSRLMHSNESLGAQMDAIFTGSVDTITYKDSSRKEEFKDSKGISHTRILFSRTINLTCTFKLEKASDKSIINQQSVSDIAGSGEVNSPAKLPDPQSIAVSLIDGTAYAQGGTPRLLADLPHFLAPWKQQVTLKFKKVKSDDKAIEAQAKQADEAAKGGTLKLAQKIWNDIYAKAQIKEAGYNAALAEQAMGDLPKALAMMQKVVNDTGWTEAQAQVDAMQKRIGSNKAVAAIAQSQQQTGLDKAISQAVAELKANLPSSANIVFMNISQKDRDTVNHCIDAVSQQLTNAGMSIVDRSNAKLVNQEKKFQISGAVSDDSAVALGKALGASVMVVSSITGDANTRRLTFKVLSVETTKVIHITALPL